MDDDINYFSDELRFNLISIAKYWTFHFSNVILLLS